MEARNQEERRSTPNQYDNTPLVQSYVTFSNDVHDSTVARGSTLTNMQSTVKAVKMAMFDVTSMSWDAYQLKVFLGPSSALDPETRKSLSSIWPSLSDRLSKSLPPGPPGLPGTPYTLADLNMAVQWCFTHPTPGASDHGIPITCTVSTSETGSHWIDLTWEGDKVNATRLYLTINCPPN